MDKIEAYKRHYKMWDWLVRHPDKDKYDYINLTHDVNLNLSNSHCYLCIIHGNNCACPLHKNESCVATESSIYNTWLEAKKLGKTKYIIELAQMIRDCVLPYLLADALIEIHSKEIERIAANTMKIFFRK